MTTWIEHSSSLAEFPHTEFLTGGTKTAKIAYLSRKSSPLVSPIWFLLENDAILFQTGKSYEKGKYLLDNRDDMCICLDEERPPYNFVQIRGKVEISEDEELKKRVSLAIAEKYEGKDKAREVSKMFSGPHVITVTLTPHRINYKIR